MLRSVWWCVHAQLFEETVLQDLWTGIQAEFGAVPPQMAQPFAVENQLHKRVQGSGGAVLVWQLPCSDAMLCLPCCNNSGTLCQTNCDAASVGEQ